MTTIGDRHRRSEAGGSTHFERRCARRALGTDLAGFAAGLAISAAFTTAPVTGTVVLAAAALGAFGGGHVGGIASSEDGSTTLDTAKHVVAEPGGVVVAIRTNRDAGDENRALRSLRASGAIGLFVDPSVLIDRMRGTVAVLASGGLGTLAAATGTTAAATLPPATTAQGPCP